MSGVTKAISQEVYQQVINLLKTVPKKKDATRKLQAIKAAKEKSITLAAKIFCVSRPTIMSWIARFAEEGIEGFEVKPGRGPKEKLNQSERQEVACWLKKDCNLTIKAVRIKIEKFFNKKLGYSTTHRLIRSLNFSYITPRARDYKKNSHEALSFKKKSPRKMQSKS